MKLEDYENQSNHLDSFHQLDNSKDSECLVADKQKTNEESLKVVSNADMNELSDNFGKLEQNNSDLSQCCQGESTCSNTCSSKNELKDIIGRESDVVNPCENDVPVNHCAYLKKFVYENASLILIPFNESVKVKILNHFCH